MCTGKLAAYQVGRKQFCKLLIVDFSRCTREKIYMQYNPNNVKSKVSESPGGGGAAIPYLAAGLICVHEICKTPCNEYLLFKVFC